MIPTNPQIQSNTGGYTCPQCGQWVATNSWHYCTPKDPPNYIYVLERIAIALERLIELLKYK